MAVKTLTFKFKKKTKFKFDKDNFVNKSGKKKVLGLQGMSFLAGGFSYHIAPLKISKNELSVEKKDKDLLIDGLIKFKVNVRDAAVTDFVKAIKNQDLFLQSFQFNTDPTPGIELTSFTVNPDKTKEFIEIS
mgnify:FL=1|tara:strand:+ start:125 stop:520 length:396 start_codon:yes stop_codon:yes gene_type:complete